MAYDYDLIVLGGGAAGLTVSGIAATFGARTLLVERHRLGGDCTWTGCVPSKALLKSAKVAYQCRTGAEYGVAAGSLDVDFRAVMDRVRRIRQEVYLDADTPERYESLGVAVRYGRARFENPHTISVEGEPLTARRFAIRTGARAAVPPIPGLRELPFLTNETLFELSDLPRRFAVIGAGPVGLEMAQAFARLGSHVTVMERLERILPSADTEVSTILKGKLEREGVCILTGAHIQSVGQTAVETTLNLDGGTRLSADALLVVTGRQPNTEELNLAAAGVVYTTVGIPVNNRCRTNIRHIWAVGDVTGQWHYTHMSEHTAKVAAANAILRIPLRVDAKSVPRTVFTEPELAEIGETKAELRARAVKFREYRFPYSRLDRALMDGETEGLVKVFTTPHRGKILGAAILGTAAGELICELALAVRHGITLRGIADTIHPYPTYGLGVRRAADQRYVRRASERLARVIRRIFRYRGKVVKRNPDKVI